MYSLINDPQPIARFNSTVTPDLEHIVLKALAKDREERYQHSDDLLADLRGERKNLEYARTGYIRTSTVTLGVEEEMIGRVMSNHAEPRVSRFRFFSRSSKESE